MWPNANNGWISGNFREESFSVPCSPVLCRFDFQSNKLKKNFFIRPLSFLVPFGFLLFVYQVVVKVSFFL